MRLVTDILRVRLRARMPLHLVRSLRAHLRKIAARALENHRAEPGAYSSVHPIGRPCELARLANLACNTDGGVKRKDRGDTWEVVYSARQLSNVVCLTRSFTATCCPPQFSCARTTRTTALGQLTRTIIADVTARDVNGDGCSCPGAHPRERRYNWDGNSYVLE